MRNIKNIIFGRDTKTSGLIALVITLFIALGCNCSKNLDLGNLSNSSTTPSNTASNTSKSTSTTKADASKAEVPSDDQVQDMTRETLLDFDSSVKSGDFTAFHSHIAQEWQRQTTPEKLKVSFKAFIDKRIDISSIGSKTASFDSPPGIEKILGYKTLVVKGKYPTSPNSTKFILNYIANGKDWKLSKIVVDTTSSDTADDITTSNSSDQPSSAVGVTKEGYESIKTGMKYEDVVKIFGKEGEEISSNDIAGYKTIVYKWSGEKALSAVTIIFQNGKVTSKSQFGL